MTDEDFDIREQQLSSSEKEFENALRPLAFNDFSGQQQVVENWVRQRYLISLPTS